MLSDLSLVHQRCAREFIGDIGMLFQWKGQDSSKPIVCMTHYDVVPIHQEQWSKPAFGGIVEEELSLLSY